MMGRRPEQDLAGRGGLLEPGGHVDGLARDERRVGRLVDDELAGLDPDPGLESELVDRAAHGERRARGALGVVLVGLWNPERGEHGVAGELLDDPAVERDAMRDRLEELGHAAANDLGIGARDHAGRVHEVHEEDRRKLSLHA